MEPIPSPPPSTPTGLALALAPVHADRFAPLSPEAAERWRRFYERPGRTFFPNVVGLVIEEVRVDYCRMRLPYRPELNQPAGVVHGGATASLVDTVVVPAVASAYEEIPNMLTLQMSLSYLGAIVETDAVAEGWVVRRGRSTVFCRAEVRVPTTAAARGATGAGTADASAGGTVVATADLVYAVRPR